MTLHADTIQNINLWSVLLFLMTHQLKLFDLLRFEHLNPDFYSNVGKLTGRAEGWASMIPRWFGFFSSTLVLVRLQLDVQLKS